MDNKEVKNNNDVNDDIKKVIDELKMLPEVKLPTDFERELKNKITRGNLNKQNNLFSFPYYSKALVFGGSFIVIICLVIFSVTIFRNVDVPVIKEVAAIDSTYYGEKKVIIIPPTETNTEGTLKKPIDKIGKRKDKPVESEEMKEYFGNEKMEKTSKSVPLNNYMAPASERKSMEMDRSINIDTLRKKDSLKKIIDKKK